MTWFVLLLLLFLFRLRLAQLHWATCHAIAVIPIQSQCLKHSRGHITGEQRPQRGQDLTSLGSAMSPIETFIAGCNMFTITRLVQPGLSPFFEEWIWEILWGLLVLRWISLTWSFCHSTMEQLFPLGSLKCLETFPRGPLTLGQKGHY